MHFLDCCASAAGASTQGYPRFYQSTYLATWRSWHRTSSLPHLDTPSRFHSAFSAILRLPLLFPCASPFSPTHSPIFFRYDALFK